MHNPSRKTSKHINLNLLALTFHLIFLIPTVHSRSTQHCLGLLDDTIFDLETAISKLQTSSLGAHDVNMLLSDAMTNQDTCLEGFKTSGIHEKNSDNTYKLTDSLKDSILKISSNLSNSLGMLQKIPGHELSPEAYEVDVEFPSWVLENDKRRLHAPVEKTKFNLMVAQDGTGNFTTINDAVSAAPTSSVTRFMIYIKRGVYFENVEIPKNKTIIMFVGDGIGRTVIKANRRKGNLGTFQTATVGVKGEGFIAKDISFVNFAGPSPQAVALRSGSDHSAFYRCSFEGYQDTLYVYSGKQFYRECDIYGTVDFICGNAAAVFQNCSLFARKPNPGQKIVYTAQSRTCPNQSTEYMNEGPGSNITNRVKWPGYRPILNETEATQFTVGPFIDGGTWLNSTGIPFNTGL
ncbi:BnaA09g00730D [Brassica napus]|uniref:BnaA09g00730D protein n=1 Tax=Brassica napus TaxID=3708 RepID=A0A078G9M6_BRANA|nr:BnaA09g00730D [Brassica napus]